MADATDSVGEHGGDHISEHELGLGGGRIGGRIGVSGLLHSVCIPARANGSLILGGWQIDVAAGADTFGSNSDIA